MSYYVFQCYMQVLLINRNLKLFSLLFLSFSFLSFFLYFCFTIWQVIVWDYFISR